MKNHGPREFWLAQRAGDQNQAPDCAGDIQNVNGQLTCNEAGVGSSKAPARPSTPMPPKY